MTHSDLVNEILLFIAPLGIAWKNNTGAIKSEGRFLRYGLKGSSDILACIDGRFVGIEVKVGKDRLRTEQKAFAEAIVTRGKGVIILARSVEDVAVNLIAHGFVSVPEATV